MATRVHPLMILRVTDWHASVEKGELLERFKTLHPGLLAVMA